MFCHPQPCLRVKSSVNRTSEPSTQHGLSLSSMEGPSIPGSSRMYRGVQEAWGTFSSAALGSTFAKSNGSARAQRNLTEGGDHGNKVAW